MISSIPQSAPEPSVLSAVAELAAKPFSTLDEVIEAALRLMSDVVGVQLTMIHRVEGENLIVSHLHNNLEVNIVQGVSVPRSESFCDVVLRHVAPLIVLDADEEPWAHLFSKRYIGTKSYVGVPIVLNDSRVFGTLCAHDQRALTFAQREVDFLLVLARFVASHVEREEAIATQRLAAHNLADRNFELTTANQRLLALSNIADSIATHLDLRAILRTVVVGAVELLGAHGGAISLIGERIDAPRVLTATYNLPESLTAEAIPANAGLMGQVIAAQGPVIIDRYASLDAPLIHREFHELAPWIGVPIWWESQIVGTFGIGAKDDGRVFNERDTDHLTQVAKHAAVAIENARLYSASRGLGAAEERNRLAAEIHDTLAQSLLSLTFQLRTARSLVGAAPDRARAELLEAEQRTREALEEARRSVWNLGPASLEAGSLLEALRGELDASERAGLPGRLVIGGSIRPLQAESQLALFRVAQEALANARKHAHAQNAEIMLDFHLDEVTITVADDGRGFDLAHAKAQGPRHDSGFGLTSMTERVQRIGGRLSIASSIGGGTTVIASVPYEFLLRVSAAIPPVPLVSSAAAIRVIVADDHPAMRTGIASILSQQDGITVIATAANGEEAVDLVAALIPDVLMVDLRMPKLSGVEAIARIAKLGVPTRSVAVTTFAQDELVMQAIRAGARGYLLKDAGAEELGNAVRVVSAGGTLLTPAIASKLAEGLANQERLTARERQVLALLAHGLSDKEIAGDLSMSVKTASFHVANVIAKLGAQNRAEAVRLAYERGHLVD